MQALYLDRSLDARPLPRGLTGHVAHPLRSIQSHPGAVLVRLRLPRSGRVQPTTAHRLRPTETEADCSPR